MRRYQDPKIKLTVYVSRIVASQLDLVCNDRTKNKSNLTETALAKLLSPQHDEDTATPRRLDRLSHDVGHIHRHQQIMIESLGQQRFQHFIEQVSRRLASTSTLGSEISEQLGRHDPKAKGEANALNTSQTAAPDLPFKP